MTMILNCQLCGRRFYANTKHTCQETDSRIIELLEKILDRMPEPEKTHPCPGCGTFTDKRVCNSCWGTSDDPEAGYSQAESIEGEPAPADDLPGEPVEPGDLRAGDRVEFTWDGERIACILVSGAHESALISDTPDSDGYIPGIVGWNGEWCGGISDVRLIERAPREDEDPDVALAKMIHETERAHIESEMGVDVESWEGASEFTRTVGLIAARAAREHIEANQLYAYRTVAAERDKAEADLADMTRQRDEWQARHAALREDVARYESEMGYVSAYMKVQLLAVKNRLVGILARDRERQGGN